jgi:hypothetical protein
MNAGDDLFGVLGDFFGGGLDVADNPLRRLFGTRGQVLFDKTVKVLQRPNVVKEIVHYLTTSPYSPGIVETWGFLFIKM